MRKMREITIMKSYCYVPRNNKILHMPSGFSHELWLLFKPENKIFSNSTKDNLK